MALSLNDRVIKARINLLRRSPFFGTLLLNAPYYFSKGEDGVLTAATDGQNLYINESFVDSMDDEVFCGVLCHEVLHMALQHVDRLKRAMEEDHETANIAADIVVNGILRANNIALFKGAILDSDLEHLSAIEIYSILRKHKLQKQSDQGKGKQNKGLGDGNGKGSGSPKVNPCLQPQLAKSPNGPGGDKESQGNSPKDSPQTKTNWKDVMNKARIIAKSRNAGTVGAGLNRIFKEFLEPTIDWRTVLYKYIVDSRTDFEAFDRRFIYRGDYFDDLGGGKINVKVFMDTSASVDEKLLSEFIAELRFAVNALPQISGEMWYFDTKLYPLGDIKEILGTPKIKGGGGTSFGPAINLLNKSSMEDVGTETLGIIFTDGHASFKLPTPLTKILWCVNPGGVENEKFPFGEVVRIHH